MGLDEFKASVARALDEIEAAFPGVLKNVAVCVEEKSGQMSCRAVGLLRNDTLMGLYEGVQRSSRSFNEGWILPDKITLFVEPITREADACGVPVTQIVREVVWHEVGHLVGLDEKQAKAVERRRRTGDA